MNVAERVIPVVSVDESGVGRGLSQGSRGPFTGVGPPSDQRAETIATTHEHDFGPAVSLCRARLSVGEWNGQSGRCRVLRSSSHPEDPKYALTLVPYLKSRWRARRNVWSGLRLHCELSLQPFLTNAASCRVRFSSKEPYSMGP